MAIISALKLRIEMSNLPANSSRAIFMIFFQIVNRNADVTNTNRVYWSSKKRNLTVTFFNPQSYWCERIFHRIEAEIARSRVKMRSVRRKISYNIATRKPDVCVTAGANIYRSRISANISALFSSVGNTRCKLQRNYDRLRDRLSAWMRRSRIVLKSLVHLARHVARAPNWHFYMARQSRTISDTCGESG